MTKVHLKNFKKFISPNKDKLESHDKYISDGVESYDVEYYKNYINKNDCLADTNRGFQRFHYSNNDKGTEFEYGNPPIKSLMVRFIPKAYNQLMIDSNKDYNAEFKSQIANYKTFLGGRMLGIHELLNAEGKKINDTYKYAFIKYDEILNDLENDDLLKVLGPKDLEERLFKIAHNIDAELVLALTNEDKINDAQAKMQDAMLFSKLHFERSFIMTVREQYDGTKFISLETPIDPMPILDYNKNFMDIENKEWFKPLDSFKQKLIRKNIDKLKSGNYVIPNHMNFMPGLRNAFTRNDIVIDENGQELASNEVIHMATQSASGVFKNKKIAQDIADKNAQYLYDYNNHNVAAKLNLISLVSPNDIITKESKMNQNVSLAIESHNKKKPDSKIIFTPIAVNLFKDWYGAIPIDLIINNINNDLQDLRNEIARHPPLYPSIKDEWQSSINQLIVFLKAVKKGSNKINISNNDKLNKFITDNTNFFKQLHNEKNKSFIIRIFNTIVNILKVIFRSKNIDNPQMDIALGLTKFIRGINAAAKDLGLTKDDKYINVINCKSGKDRTGAFVSIDVAISLEEQLRGKSIKIDKDAQKSNKITQNDILQITLGHQDYLNGSPYGGNAAIGAGGIKYVMIPKEYQEAFEISGIEKKAAKLKDVSGAA